MARRKKKTYKTQKAKPGKPRKKQIPSNQKKSNPTGLRRLFWIGVSIVLIGLGVLVIPDLFKKDKGIEASKEVNKEVKPFPIFDEAALQESIQFEDYVGSESCASCHAEEYNLWKESTHGKAGGTPQEQKVLGDFDGQTRKFKDGEVTPHRRGNKYYFEFDVDHVRTQRYPVDAMVGGGHMIAGGTQTYFSEYTDGTFRFIPFDYIRDEEVWFGETNQGRGWIPITEDLSVNELSEFPPSRILGSHRQMENCQECHGSQIQVKYNPDLKKYKTDFTTLAINCESCHGPGKRHIELMNAPAWDTLSDIGMAALNTLDKDASLNVCFQCHALKDVLEPGYLQGMDLESHYSLKSPMVGENPYHPDGRIKAFGYQQNHIFSDCYINGSMTCVDCHDPHSQGYRDFNGVPLADPFDNGQCTGCHASKAEDPTAHSHHPEGSEGNKCVHCHMPYLQHQAMGTELRFARSDHTIPIPRPAFDAQLGIENACFKCHPDKSIEWLQSKTDEWYGELKPHKQWVTNLLEAEGVKSLDQAEKLLLPDTSVHPVGQMMGLSQFLNSHLSPNMQSLDPDIIDEIKQFVLSPDLDVKSVALASLHLTQDYNSSTHNYLIEQLEALNEKAATKVRKRWATILPYLAKQYEEQERFDEAIGTYRKALKVWPDQPAILSNLAYTYQRMGNHQQAVRYYQQAARLDPYNAMAWVNLGNAQGNAGDAPGSIESYYKAIEINPWNTEAHFNIGNYFYRAGSTTRAIEFYQKAVERNPALADGYFNLARAYIKSQQYEEAFAVVKAGLQFRPEDATGNQMFNDLEEAYRKAGMN